MHGKNGSSEEPYGIRSLERHTVSAVSQFFRRNLYYILYLEQPRARSIGYELLIESRNRKDMQTSIVFPRKLEGYLKPCEGNLLALFAGMNDLGRRLRRRPQ